MSNLILALILNLSVTIAITAQTTGNSYHETNTSKITVTNDSISNCDYCGNYQLKENPYIDEVSINIKDGNLIASATNYNDITLKPTDKDAFYVSTYHAKVVFTRKESVVTGIMISAQSLKFTGDKL